MQHTKRQSKKPAAYAAILFFLLASCGTEPENQGTSTPIDSTNTFGTAPATYGADDPTEDVLKNKENFSDTGTKVNEGPDNTR